MSWPTITENTIKAASLVLWPADSEEERAAMEQAYLSVLNTGHGVPRSAFALVWMNAVAWKRSHDGVSMTGIEHPTGSADMDGDVSDDSLETIEIELPDDGDPS